jgi:hypothetical protein
MKVTGFIFLFGAILLASCRHEEKTVLYGNLKPDFFLVGDYYCYRIFNHDSLKSFNYDLDDGLFLSVSPVENGFSRLTWKIHDSIVDTELIADYSVPWDNDAYNTHCNCISSLVHGLNSAEAHVAAFNCYPNNLNFGYTNDSIVDLNSKFVVGPTYFASIP